MLEVLIKLKAFSGKEIPVDHSLGAAATILENYPKTKKWLYRKIRDGYMTEEAFRYFQHFVVKLKSEQ